MKLIVQITLDQFKSDYLDRFGPAFNYGFKRVQEEGIVFERGIADHAITDSFPGHATLSTGLYPRNHGLSANAWWELKDGLWQSINSEDDENTHIIGFSDRMGTSPKNMNATTIADWVKAENSGAKAISLSAGTKISMAYAGKTGNAAYWLDRPSGRFVSSSYYIDKYPSWVDNFNDAIFPGLKNEIWNSEVPTEYRSLAEADNSEYENGGKHTVFPHRFDNEIPEIRDVDRNTLFNEWFYNTPMADEALFALAMRVVTEEKLGADDQTDYLSITINTTDNVGHDFGGRSQEILDTLLRIDRKLGEFITFLDKQVGGGSYLIAISGDHGAPEVIEYQQQNFGTGLRISQDQVDVLLDEIESEVKTGSLHGESLVRKIERIIEQHDFIYDAITQEEIDEDGNNRNPYLDLYRKTWVKGRVPAFPLRVAGRRDHHPARYGIFAQFKENTTYDAATVVHGSPYLYDRLVPVMFFGLKGLKLKSAAKPVARTVDVAPTLADLAGISYPDGLDGKVLVNRHDGR